MGSYCGHAPSSTHEINFDQSCVRGARAQETIELPLPPHLFDSSLIVCYSPRELGQVQNESETS